MQLKTFKIINNRNNNNRYSSKGDLEIVSVIQWNRNSTTAIKDVKRLFSCF